MVEGVCLFAHELFVSCLERPDLPCGPLWGGTFPSFVIGAFDGFVRLNHFDASYFKEEVVEDPDLQKMLDSMTEEELYELQHEDDPEFQRSDDETDEDDEEEEEEEEGDE
jgi:hypothetical protein